MTLSPKNGSIIRMAASRSRARFAMPLSEPNDNRCKLGMRIALRRFVVKATLDELPRVLKAVCNGSELHLVEPAIIGREMGLHGTAGRIKVSRVETMRWS